MNATVLNVLLAFSLVRLHIALIVVQNVCSTQVEHFSLRFVT